RGRAGHGDRHPHRPHARRSGVRAGRCRGGGGLRPARRGGGDPGQGRHRPVGHRRGRDPAGGPVSAAPRGRLRGRPGLAATVLACAAGAALVLLAAGRTWAVRVADRPAPLPEARTALTGGDRVAWLPSLAWAALAAGAGLPAGRGHAGRGLGGLLAVAGAAMAVAAGVAGERSGSPAGWPALATFGAAAVAAAGGLALTASGDWPAVGARYER